jgi:DNA-binding transcriptional ArsR family regulator
MKREPKAQRTGAAARQSPVQPAGAPVRPRAAARSGTKDRALQAAGGSNPGRHPAGGRARSSAPRGSIDAEAMRAHADEASRLLRTLAHGQRLRVLCLLVDGELSVGEINERIDLSQSALSQHLARLRADRLVATRREAQTIYYRLASGPARQLLGALHGIYCG